MEVTVRLGGPGMGWAPPLEDYLAVMRDSSLYRHYYGADETPLRTYLSDALAREALFAAVNSRDEVAGLMVCDWKGMCGVFPYLALLGVRRDFRGMGVGHRLLDTFEQVSRKLGARNIFICVSGFNPRARALYQSVGFRKLAVAPDFMKDGIAENILMKRLEH